MNKSHGEEGLHSLTLMSRTELVLAPSLSTGPQENRSAAIMDFATIYMYLSNFMEEYHTRQCLACSQTPRSVCSFIRCVHSLFCLHLGCGCPIDSRQYYVTTWGCCTIVCDHMRMLYHCMWPHEDAVPLYVTTWGCCTIVCDHMKMLYHCM